MIKLSIIVPVYNVESYIEKCITSLYQQDLPLDEYEVICVDDCSPDGSIGKIEELRGKNGYRNLTILRHTENKRQGGARNTGLKVAQGEYILFVDSDDYVMPNVFGKLIQISDREKLDILICDHVVVGQTSAEGYETDITTGRDYLLDDRNVAWNTKCSVVWAKLIRKSLLDEHTIRFAEHVQFEDCDYGIRMFAYAERVKRIPYVVYCYRVVEGSTMHKPQTYQTLQYAIALINRYVTIHKEFQNDIQWEHAMSRLIRDDVYDLLRILKHIAPHERQLFYKYNLGNIPAIRGFITSRAYCALHSRLALMLLYKNI